MHSFVPFSSLEIFVKEFKIAEILLVFDKIFAKFCQNHAEFALNCDQIFQQFSKMQHER